MKKILSSFFKENKMQFIIVGISFLFVAVYWAYISRYNCFLYDDFWYGRYMPEESIFDCLKFVGHGEGYLGYFIFKILATKIPLLLGLHPIDFIGVPHGFIKGIFFCLVSLSISVFFNFNKKERNLYFIYYVLFSVYMVVQFTIEHDAFVLISYKFYRYVFSLIFFSLFWFYMVRNILSINNKNIFSRGAIILVCIYGYIIGSSIEITFFVSATLSIIIILYNLTLNCISKLRNDEEIKEKNKFHLDIRFYLPVTVLLITVYLFTSSSGFRDVSIDRGILDAFSNLVYIKEFTIVFIKKYIIEQLCYWLIYLVFMFLSFSYAIKRKEIKKVIFPILLTISIIIVMSSLLLLGKTYPHEDPNNLTFWLFHSEIQPLCKMLLLYPLTMYLGYVNTILKTPKYIFLIFLIAAISFFMQRKSDVSITRYFNDNHILKSKNVRQYMYEKMIRFYMLKNIKPIIPLKFAQEDFNELYSNEAQVIKQLYFDAVVYKDDKIMNTGYTLSEDALEQFENNGGQFTEEELKYPHFYKLLDDEFVLNKK